jgi:membrane associated rhomboid family serine protease
MPIWDSNNPLRRIKHAYVNWALLSVNVLVFMVFQSGLVFDQSIGEGIDVLFGAIPIEIRTSTQVVEDVHFFPEPVTLFTYMFLHANTMHLLGNMVVLFICGDNVEDALGHRRYFLFYIFCGVVAGMVHVYFNPTSTIPLVGASGAIAGVIGGYVVLFPRVKMWALVGIIPLRFNASWVLGWWALSQVTALFIAPSEKVGIWAHIGGFVLGVLLILVMRPRAATVLQAPISELAVPPPPPPPPPLS